MRDLKPRPPAGSVITATMTSTTITTDTTIGTKLIPAPGTLTTQRKVGGGLR